MNALAPISAAPRSPRFQPSRGSLAKSYAAARLAADPPPGALRLFDTVPPGHLVLYAPDDAAAPLIQAGEIAIVDPEVCDFFVSDGLSMVAWGRRSEVQYGRARTSYVLREVHRSTRRPI